MSSSPPFTSAQPRESLLETEIEDLSSDDSLYEDSGTDIEGIDNKSIGGSTNPPFPADKNQSISSSGASGAPRKANVRPSTWLSQTAPDRAIQNSIDQLRAQDLSLHLFNAHALKKRARLARLKTEEPHEIGSLWQPPKHWTAWPLPSDEVPRLQKGTWADGEDNEPIWRSLEHPDGPSGDLCEHLIAVVLKTAKERFAAEDFQHDTANPSTAQGLTSSNPTSVPTSRAATATEASITSSTADSEEDPEDSSSEMPSRHVVEEPPSSDEVDQSSARGRRFPKTPKPRNQANQPTQPAAPSSSSLLLTLPPTILADEDLAASILRPSLRHLLSNLDALLTGLHHARRASLRVNDDSASASETHTDDGDGEPHTRSRPASASDKSPASQPRAKRARRSRRQGGRMGLRDWSDVLGVAALQGWDRAVVDAAAGRCAALFGEGMEFRVVGGGDG
ncbi:hypothetical protein MMC11_008516 [Xylographa trunciseda]|nr:hypothetical protein [Xylographa trunciseda]